jgi:D-alanyl-D-alanine carboxypeptidase
MTEAGQKIELGTDDVAMPIGGVKSAMTTAFWTVGSLGALVAVMIWAYGLGARDPAEVPALNAGTASWRATPENAGGRVIPGQDAQVYARLGDASSETTSGIRASSATSRPTEAEIAAARARAGLEPGAPTDAVLSMVRAKVETPESAERATVIDLDLETPRMDVAAASPTSDAIAERPDMPPNTGEGTDPAPANAATAVSIPVQTARATSSLVPAANAVAQSTSSGIDLSTIAFAPPSPKPRPQNAADTSLQTSVRTQISEYQVQLAALPSVAAVNSRWEELRAQAPQLLGSYSLKVQPVTVSGSRLFRLRVEGFAARQDAARLCRQLRALNIDCFAAKG